MEVRRDYNNETNPKVETITKIDWSKFKFIARPDTWYIEGSEAKCQFDYGEPRVNEIVESNVGMFYGMTMETYKGFDNEKLPRPDEEGCLFNEFDITLHDVNVNQMTYYELLNLIIVMDNKKLNTI